VQQHVGCAVVGHNEAVALGGVKPFDDAGNLDEVHRRAIGSSKGVDGRIPFDCGGQFTRGEPVGARAAQ